MDLSSESELLEIEQLLHGALSVQLLVEDFDDHT
jgi:hypothetical protein